MVASSARGGTGTSIGSGGIMASSSAKSSASAVDSSAASCSRSASLIWPSGATHSVCPAIQLSAVEAVQFGIPSVISKQSGVAEVLKGALKFDYWDINKASEYILSLLNDDVLTEKVREDAFKDLENISWDKSAAKVLEGYQKYNLIPNPVIA